MWLSWPHACITPSFTDWKGKLLFSVIGSASISALKATTFPLFFPSRIPTTPFTPTFLVTEIPRDSRCLAITSEVLNSLFETSGYLWNSCLHEINFSSISVIWVSIVWEYENWVISIKKINDKFFISIDLINDLSAIKIH